MEQTRAPDAGRSADGAGVVLAMENVVKRFPGVVALDGAGLSIREAEIHGLIGENGAGKSTIIKVLSGVLRPDSGSIRVGEAELGRVTPAVIRAHGVRFVHQELTLVPHQTVGEAVYLGQEVTVGGMVRPRLMRRRAEEFLADHLGAEVDGGRLVRDLGPAERKLVQIARALVDGRARLVVLDEPTAPLGAAEVRRVFEAMRRLTERGVAVLYVSHYLSEIQEVCDRVTVLREGRTIGVAAGEDLASSDRLIEMMVGRRIDQLFPTRTPVTDGRAETLRVDGLGVDGQFEDVSLTVRPGEIVGLAGLLGSGRHALVDAITGLRKPTAGSVTVAGRRVRAGSRVAAVAAGLALVPRDRRHSGVVLRLPVAGNVVLTVLPRLARWGVVRRRAEGAQARRTVEDLDIRPRSTGTLAGLLSGGNQQKVVLGRWIAADAPVLILEEPTVGVDVSAKAEIYGLVARLAAAGAAVLISANDTDELAGLAHRVLVLQRGRVTAEIDMTVAGPDQLLALVTGVSAIDEPVTVEGAA